MHNHNIKNSEWTLSNVSFHLRSNKILCSETGQFSFGRWSINKPESTIYCNGWAVGIRNMFRYGTLTIRYISRYLSHDTIRIAIPGENRKMNQLITIGSLYCILCVCTFNLSRQHLAFALLVFNYMNTLYIIV